VGTERIEVAEAELSVGTERIEVVEAGTAAAFLLLAVELPSLAVGLEVDPGGIHFVAAGMLVLPSFEATVVAEQLCMPAEQSNRY
jgi:hypothetical protein